MIKIMILLIGDEKAFDRIHHPFMITALNKLGIEGRNLILVKTI